MPKLPFPNLITIKEALRIVGKKKDYLKDLDSYIRINYKISGEFKFSKKNGWSIFYRKNGKSLCYVNLRERGFNVTVVIGASLNDVLKSSLVSTKINTLFKNAHQYHDGKWLHITVETKRDIEDIKQLLLIKKKPIKNSRQSE